MGVELVEGHDLVVDGRRSAHEDDAGAYARSTSSTAASTTTSSIRSSSVRIRCSACRASSTSTAPASVTIVNAPGAGIADDKAIYSYIPEIIEFYTGRAPILQERADLQLPQARTSSKYVLEHLAELVVKEVHGSGGYGMLVGPTASKDEIEAFRAKLKARPEQLHRPADAGAVDLPDAGRGRAWRRATSICGPSCCSATQVRLMPGGLTRVALREGSLVVNSSQGGGTKDTWVLQD